MILAISEDVAIENPSTAKSNESQDAIEVADKESDEAKAGMADLIEEMQDQPEEQKVEAADEAPYARQ